MHTQFFFSRIVVEADVSSTLACIDFFSSFLFGFAVVDAADHRVSHFALLKMLVPFDLYCLMLLDGPSEHFTQTCSHTP